MPDEPRSSSDTTSLKDEPRVVSTPDVLEYAPGTSLTLVTVATFGESWEAHLAAGKLESEGIRCWMADENIVAAGGRLYTGATGGVKLQVTAADLERASTLLPRRVRPTLVKCPGCRSTETHMVPLSAAVQVLFLLMLGLPYLFSAATWCCTDCGHVWKRSRFGDDDFEDEEPAADTSECDSASEHS